MRLLQTATAAAAASSLLLAQSATAATPPPFPSIDFDALGQVGVVGAFAGLEIWNNSLSQSSAALSGNALNANSSTLLARAQNGSLIQIGATNVGGQVNAICQLEGDNAGVFFGGNFSAIGNITASNVASWNPTTQVWDGIAGGINGAIDAVYCDTTHQTVVFGGSFAAPVNAVDPSIYKGNVALWNANTGTWSPPAFGGLNGDVRVITQGTNTSMVRFGGSFTAALASGSIQGAGVSSGVNTSASPITSGLSPISLAQSELTGGPASSIAGFGNPAQILCPQGADGPGNSYLFEDGIAGQLTVRTFRQTGARAFRIGNTDYQGRGTKTFSIVSIPDDTVLDLVYLDPATNQNATCKEACPLAQASSTLPFQDFLIADTPNNNAAGGTKALTGFQFTAIDHYGAGAGLHILELLSDGAWAYAYDASNRGACSSSEIGVNGTYSTASSQGGWYTASYSSVTGTTESYLALTDSNANLGNNAGAQVSWDVYVPVAGNYSVYLQVPGCQQTATCGQRTDVQVTVFNAPGSQGISRTISEDVQDLTSVLVYDGEIAGATPSFMPSVVLSLKAGAPQPSAGRFTVVADRINFMLLNSTLLPLTSQNAFGLLEYDLFDASAASTTTNTSALSNSTMTALDTFAIALRTAGVAQNSTEYVSAIASTSGSTFVAGRFRAGNGDPLSSAPINATSSDFANIVSYTNASNGANITRLAGGGLLGPVSGLVVVGNYLYAGGNFTATADGKTALLNVAQYDPAANSWAALGSGLSGPVSSVSLLDGTNVLFTGNFNDTGLGGSTGGYAVWNTAGMAWQNQDPLVVGSMMAGSGAPSTDNDGFSYLAGSIAVLSTNSAPGAAFLHASDNNGVYPAIMSLNFQFDSGSGGSMSALLRRGLDWLSNFAQQVHVRGLQAAKDDSKALLPRWLQLAKTEELFTKRQQASDPLSPPSLFSDDRNQVLATTFWQRGDGEFAQIIGGNFTTTANITNIGVYDQSSNLLTALPAFPLRNNAPTISVVRTLSVVNDTLFVGGDGGMQIFNLASGEWNSNMASLNINNKQGTAQLASVTNVVHRPLSSTVVASGTFDSAGSLPCPSVCEWDMLANRWMQLGTGFAGTVTSMDFANVR